MSHGRSVAARVDADPAIGIGHLTRCVTLLKRLRADGFDVRLLPRRALSPDLVAVAGGLPISTLEAAAPAAPLATEEGDADATLAAIGRPDSGFWIVVDHYRLSECWERRIKNAGHRVLVLDDYRNRRHCADIVVSDHAAPFDPQLIDGCGAPTLLLGPPYALIGEDYAARPVEPKAAAATILISYGGSDPTGETLKALDAVARIREQRRGAPVDAIHVTIGPANTAGAAIQQRAQRIGAFVHVAPSSLAALMRDADLVLTAGGNTMIEALTMRKPCLVTPVADNQSPMVEELHRQGAIVVVGWHADVNAGELADAIEQVLSDYGRIARAMAASSQFDHLGAARISSAMQALG